jgi:hypothetical protein
MMKRLKFLLCMIFFAGVAMLSWGMDPGWAQQAPGSSSQNRQGLTNYEKIREELAAKRAAQGQMRSTTPAQRKAAAERLKALLEGQKKQSAPISEGEVNK